MSPCKFCRCVINIAGSAGAERWYAASSLVISNARAAAPADISTASIPPTKMILDMSYPQATLNPKFILLGGVLALLTVGATNLAKIPKPAVAQHHEPIDPAILTTYLQRSSGEIALP